MTEKLTYKDPYPGRNADDPEWDPCGRCGGAGHLAGYEMVDGGICYECWGAKGHMTSIRTLRARESSRISRENKRIAEDAKRAARHQAAEDELTARDPRCAKWLEVADTNSFLLDLWTKAWSYELSDKQKDAAVAAIARHFDRIAEREAEKAELAEVIEGKQTVRGEVLRVKTTESQWGTAFKMIVMDERKFKVWSTIPAPLIRKFEETLDEGVNVYAVLDKLVGHTVEFTATVKRSDDDKTFGFASSPSKGAIIA